ncbi:MAG: hypothetical protein DRO11_08325 [Methanobacteriota archaeon]|nr:MAG: hypothetical protein DRO11_08325 [Euryarchaeota archaeon]
MGFASWLKKKLLRKKTQRLPEPSQLKRAMETKYSTEHGAKTVTLSKMETPSQQVVSPAVEHPLLTIQDRMSRLEEIYRSMNDKMTVLDGKVATKRDIEDVKSLIGDDLDKGDQVLHGIDALSLDIISLRAEKDTLNQTIEMSAREIEEKRKRLTTVESQIERMECDDKIIQALEGGDMSTIELAEKLGFTRQYVWERLKELSSSGAVKSIKKGRQTKYVLVN